MSFNASPNVHCLAFSEQHEPGNPAAIALRVEHLKIFDGQLFPPTVDGPDSNHFLYNLYRRVGGTDCHKSIWVQGMDSGGGPTSACNAVASSAAQPSRWLTELGAWGAVLRAHYQVRWLTAGVVD